MKLEGRIKKKLGKFLLDVAFESDGVLGLLGASPCPPKSEFCLFYQLQISS